MVDKKFYRNFPITKGKTSKQAHTNLPIINDKVTYEEEQGRQGFFGKVSHLYHINPPTGFSKIDGDFRPQLIDTNKLNPTDKDDPWGSPVTFLHNQEEIISSFWFDLVYGTTRKD